MKSDAAWRVLRSNGEKLVKIVSMLPGKRRTRTLNSLVDGRRIP